MERECCLTMLSCLIGGAALVACGWWPSALLGAASARRLERSQWIRIWFPLTPAAIAVAWLCGWALAEPDPVPEKVGLPLILASIPLALLIARAGLRSIWSLLQEQAAPAVATIGLLKPWIVFSPQLARALDENRIEAALAHERAHARHRDPLRIWLAQLATDLQWPWPQARKRLRAWRIALEFARDEEARKAGAAGADLAAAILASLRFGGEGMLTAGAALTGDPSILRERIRRLLAPLPLPPKKTFTDKRAAALAIIPVLILAVCLGAVFGEHAVRALLRISA